ncbi:MAG: YhdP family protein [Paracoccaceae bacterium]
MNQELTEIQRRKRFLEPKPRRPHQRLGIWRLFGILFLVCVMVLAGMALTGRSVVMPGWVTRQLESKVNQAIDGGRITIGQILLQVNKRGVPGLRLHNLGIFDARGAEIVRLNDVGAQISTAALLKGEFKADKFQLTGAQMTLRRRSDGQFDFSLGGGAQTTASLAGILDILDRIFDEAPLDGVNLVEAEALTINVEDGRSGRLWQITDGRMQLARMADGLDITVAFDVFNGTEDLAEIVVGIRTNKKTSAATFGTTFSNAAAADIALQSPVLSFLGVLIAPISGALRAGFGDDGTLTGLAGSLEIGRGVLQPTSDTPPVAFESSKAYFDYDPTQEKISFSELSVKTDAISLRANGHAYLRDFVEGWPSTLLTQISLKDLKVDPVDVFDQPVTFSEGAMDFRLQLDPFTVDIGQIVLVDGDEKLQAKGKISTKDAGWNMSADFALNLISFPRLMALWPPILVPKTRKWLSENIYSGVVHDVAGSVRLEPGQAPRTSVGFQFKDATVRYIKTLPNIINGAGFGVFEDKRFALSFEKGQIAAPQGGNIDLSGSTMSIANVTLKPATMVLDLSGSSDITATLSLLSMHPFKVLKNTKLPADMATGQVNFDADVSFVMNKKVDIEDVKYQVTGNLSNVHSDVLVTNRTVTAANLSLIVNKKMIEISGPANLGNASGDVTWHQNFGPKFIGTSDIYGTVQLSEAFADEFRLGLPNGSISGNGSGAFEIKFRKDQPPVFKLESDLDQVGLAIASIGWTKSRNATGDLLVEGVLGTKPSVTNLTLDAPGLDVEGGKVTLRDSGSLQTASFNRVRVGGWLDAPVTLVGRGSRLAPAVEIKGGTLDIRKTSFGGASGSKSKPTGGPISLTMDKVIITEGITLTNFAANLNSNDGLSGEFSARVNGRSRIKGTLVSERNGVAIRVQSNDAGAMARDAGLVENAFGGKLDMTLRPSSRKGVYNGRLEVSDTRVVNASAMAELLNVVSIVGLLDQLRGPGIQFSDIEGDFVLSPTLFQLKRSSAVGPSIGVSLDGIYDLTTSKMNMQGVLSPIYFLNGIGRIFSPRNGEGLFGFAFRIEGTAENPKVRVNPLSILTPGMFREIFRRPPPKVTP